MKKIILTFLSISLILNLQVFSLNGKFNLKKINFLEEQSKSLSEEIICDGSDSEDDTEIKYISSHLFSREIVINDKKNFTESNKFFSNFISSISTPPPDLLS